MILLTKQTSVQDHKDIISDPLQNAALAHDDCLGWDLDHKALYMKNMVDLLEPKGISVYLTDRYYTSGDDAERKKWELEEDEEGKLFRPIPVGELDLENNIYLNLKGIGYISSFFTLMHLYGHRVQNETIEHAPDSPDGIHCNNIVTYVGWEKPLNMVHVYDDYRKKSGRQDADYEADFFEFEREAFAFGFGLMEEAMVPVDAEVQYVVNTFIIADFDEIKSWWQNKPNKDGDDFNKCFDELYKSHRTNGGDIKADYKVIHPKQTPYKSFENTEKGVVVVCNNIVPK